jgi:uncharacterized protein (TIGR02996 family)
VRDADTELAAALAALASDDDEQALERLVGAWDLCRAEPLIALIDTLASRIEPRQKALAGKTADERYEVFRTIALATRQADLARLVALLPRLAYGDVTSALDMLLYQWPPTPRMRALLEPVRLPGYGDRIEELRAAHATPRDTQLSEHARKSLAELHRLLSTADDAGAELLAQVYADPAADAPRLVYADWATSRGDPRGELITLQFSRRDRTPDAAAVRRERELLEQYMHRWLAPIWNAIRQYSVRFERGFLSSVTVEPFAVISSRPEWSTVQALELAYHEELPMHAFPALRVLRNVTPKLLAQIASAPRALTHIGVATEPGAARPDVIAELASGHAFPDLTSLGVWGNPEDWAWIWQTPLALQLTSLEVGFTESSPWLDATLPASIREVRVRDLTNEARFLRDGLEFPRIEVICREPARDVLAWIYMIEVARAGSLREARFVLPRKLQQESIRRLEQAARRSHPALQRFTVEVDPFV